MARLLTWAPKIEKINLGLDHDFKRLAMSAMIEWPLQELLPATTMHHLNSLKLRRVNTTLHSLFRVVEAHRETLLHLRFQEVFMVHGTWSMAVSHLRQYFLPKLELFKLISCGYVQGDEVDVLDYVLQNTDEDPLLGRPDL